MQDAQGYSLNIACSYPPGTATGLFDYTQPATTYNSAVDPMGINNLGQMVLGVSYFPSAPVPPADNSHVLAAPTLPNPVVRYGACAINDAGQIFGGASDGHNTYPVLWQSSTDAHPTVLSYSQTGNTIAFDSNDYHNLGNIAKCINNKGLMGGGTVVGGTDAFLASSSGVFTLDSISDAPSLGYHLEEIDSINDNNWISGVAVKSSDGSLVSYVLVPIS